MMRFFIAGEVDTAVAEAWRESARPIERRLNAALAERDYGPAIQSIGIIPMIFRPEWQQGRPERRLFRRKDRDADYRTIIDFAAFRQASAQVRERLIVANIVDAVRDLNRKARGKFSGEALVADVLEVFGYTTAPSEIETRRAGA